MAVIDGIIPEQSFEIIHNRIGHILVTELDNQFILSGDYDLELDVYKERDIPFSEGEFRAVNVMLDRGDSIHQHPGQSNFTYRYIIEVTFDAKSNSTTLGDTIAMNKCQKIIGKIRAILEDPKYQTLGFAKPFIFNRHVENIYFGKPIKQDTKHVVAGRLTYVVTAPEVSALIQAVLIGEHYTTVKLELTDKGYLWVGRFY
jgi:hypothetical protein